MYKKHKENNLNRLYLEECAIITWKIKNCTIIFKEPVTGKELIERGELYINSKGILFKPGSELSPLYKFRYRDLIIDQNFDKSDQFIFEVTVIVEIKRDGPPSNYLFHYFKKNNKSKVLIKLENNNNSEDIVNWITIVKNVMDQEFLLDDPNYFLIKLMISRKSNLLEMSNIESSKEKTLLKNMIVQRLMPMEEQWGFLYLTNKSFYFQEIIFGDKPSVIKIPLKSVKKLLKRRYQMEHKALEIFTEKDNFYFNFKIESDRNFFYVKTRKLCKNKILTNESLNEITNKWVNRQISNFEYLLNLNNLADRSFSDFSQYPVFPWIITDWSSEKLNLKEKKIYRDLSKPIGALNEKRLIEFKKKYDQLPENEKYLYGSHYSSPGYVNCYIFRSEPLFMIKMQSGKYDISDRMFHSIQEEWEKCFNHIGCVKELIPQFFMKDTKFLVNKQYLNLGVRKDGQKVNDVILPKWAKNAKDFLEKHRQGFLKSIRIRICFGTFK